MDLTTPEDQGEFNSRPIILQLGTGSRAGPSNADYQPICTVVTMSLIHIGVD